jgi:hypothetical protein
VTPPNDGARGTSGNNPEPQGGGGAGSGPPTPPAAPAPQPAAPSGEGGAGGGGPGPSAVATGSGGTTGQDRGGLDGADGRAGSLAQEEQAQPLSNAERQSLTYIVSDWIWGVIQGGFNEKATTSQIIVDAAITMIPVVGDVAVVRDLIACIIQMVDDPARRESKLQWLQLTLLVFALLPVAGGVIKGVGRLLLKEGGVSAKLLAECLQWLRRIGAGDARKWLAELQKLKLLEYTDEVVRRFNQLCTDFRAVIETIVSKVPGLSDDMIRRLEKIVTVLDELRTRAVNMIPEAVRDLWARLEKIQKAIYDGYWHPAAVGAKTATRTVESRLINQAGGGTAYDVSKIDYPGLKSADDLPTAKGWPDLRRNPKAQQIAEACHGVPKPVWLPPGTKISRVTESPKGGPGVWWIFTKDTPKNGKAWRMDFAVLEDWSKNGLIFDIEVPKGGAWVWVSTVSSQVQKDVTKVAAGQYLPGGATQIYMDLRFGANSEVLKVVNGTTPRPSNWLPSDMTGVNAPDVNIVVQPLAAAEVAARPRVIELPTGAKVGAAAARASGNDQKSEAQP